MARSAHLVGINVLIEKMSEEKSVGNIIIPEDTKNKSLVCGRVVQKGPGFLLPVTDKKETDDINSLIGGTTEDMFRFIPLDIQEGDTVYYSKESEQDLFLEGKHFVIIPYMAIRMYIRNK